MAQRRGALADDLDALLGEADGLLEEDDDLTSALAEADALLGAPEPARPSAPTVRRPPPAEAPAAPAPVRTDQVRVPRAAVPASRAAQDLTVARGGRPTLPGGASGTDLEVIASSPASRSLIPPDPYRRPSPPQAPQEAPSLMERIVDLPGRVAGAPAQAVKGFFSGVTGAAANVAGTLAAGAFAKDAEEAKRLTVPAQFARQFLGPDPTLQPDVLDDPGVMLDPQWWGYMSGQLAGSVTALAGTGGGGQAVGRAAAGRLAALPGVAAKLAQLGGPAAATAGEAFLEASDTFTTLVQQGQDPQAAAQAAERVFSGNIALLGLSNHPLFDAGGGTFRKILTRAASEGSQEAAQQAMANIAQGRPTDEGIGTATLLGAVGGPVAGAGIDALSGQGRAPIAPPGPAGAPPSAVSSQPVPPPPPVDLRSRLQEAVAASQAARAASGFASSPAAQGQPNADLAAAVAEADAVLGETVDDSFDPTAIETPAGADLPESVQRYEAAGEAAGDVTKPQGLYTSPADVESPHADLGGERRVLRVNRNARALRLTPFGAEVVMRQGTQDAGAGVHAARELLGAEDFARLKSLSADALRAEARDLDPSVDWSRFYDAQEVMEAIGGVMARQAGYDALWMPDADPRFSEFVGLTPAAFEAPDAPADLDTVVAEADAVLAEDGAPAPRETVPDAPAAAEGLRTSKGRPMPPGTRLGTMAGSGERVFVEPVGPDGKHRIVDLDGSYSESMSPKMLANEQVGVRLDPVEADTLDTGEQQTRLPGEVGAVRDEERAQPTEEVPQQTLVLTAQEAPKPQGRIDFDAVVSEADDVLAMPAAGLRRRVLSTPERAVSTEPWMSGPSRAVRMEAIARHRFGGDRVVRNTETGHDIRIEPRGVKNALSHGIGPQKVAVVSALGDLLRDAVFVGRHTDGLRPGVVAVETYAARVRVDGAPFVARLVVREVQDGRRFYDHHLTSLEPVRAPGSPVQSGAGGAATSAPPRANRPSASPEKTLLEDALGVKSEDDGPDDVQPMALGAGGPANQVQPARASKPTLSGKGRNQGLALTHQPAPGTKTVAETPKNARPSDIVRDMAKLFEVPVGVGRLITHMALGYFHPRIREIRVRVANGLPVLTHEFGHASKRHFALSLTDARWRHELLVLGAPTSLPSYTVGQRLEEGRAEFWRLWVLEPGRAQQMAPNFFQATERRLDEMGDLGKGLRDLQRRAQAFLAADPVARVNLRIDFDGQGTQPVGAWVDRAAKHWIDDLHRLGQAVAAMAGGVPLPPSLNAYLLARNARGSAARASDFLETGVRGRDGQFIGPNLRAALQPVSDKLGEFAVYLVALRAKELHGRRMETGMTDVEVDGAIRAIESGPDAARFKQARDGVYQFQTAMLNYARDAGLLSVQAQRAIQRVNQFYVPFQRVMDDGATPGLGTGRRIADRIAPIKRIKGSGRDIINPLESIIKNAFAMVDAVEKNRAMQALATLVDKSDDVRRPGTGAGRWLRRIKDPQTLTGVKLRDVLVEVSQKAGAMWMTQSGPTINPDLEDMLNDLGIDPDQVVPVFQTAFTGPKGEQIVTVVRDGQKQFYQVADPMLFDALTQIAPIQKDRGELADVAETMAKLLRAGATLTVGFIARNPGRDTLSAFLQSRHGFIPVYDTVRGLVKTILHDLGVRHDEEVAQFWAQGVTQATLSGIDRKTLRAKVRQLADPAKHRRSVLANPLELLQALSAYSEVATRVGEFSLALRQEGTPHTIFERLRDQHTQAVIDENTLAAATLAARDVTTDFSRAGSIAREANRYAAFFNARIQGYVRIAETIRRQPGTVAVNAGMLAAVAVFFKLLADDDDDYQELAEWEKLTYWHWRPTWGTDRADFFLRIPKPFEWAFIPNAVEAAVDYARDKDPEAFKLLKAQAKENARTFLTGFLPTAIVPALEVTTNYSLFRQGPIVSPWDADLPLEQQAGDWTSQTARALTRAGVPLAPAKIDHLLYGHFAGLGRAAVSSVVDPALRLAGVAPPRATQPEARWEDVPGVGALVRSAAPKSDAESIREFYDAFREMTGHERGFRRSKDDPAQQQRILDSVKRQRWRGREAEMKAAKKKIDAIADEIDAVYADPALTPREKTMSLDGMRRALVYEARVGLGYASTDHIRRRSPR